MVTEAKRMTIPASVGSIPSSAMQEDHVSMGWGAGRKLRRAIDNLAAVLAVELYAAARAITLRQIPPSPATGAAVQALQPHTGGPRPDRFLSPELAEVVTLRADGTVVAAPEEGAPLHH